jgi:GNAT superfamily N-acetyltransferase
MYSTQQSRIDLALKLSSNADIYVSAAEHKHHQSGDGWIAALSGHPFAMLNDVFIFGDRPDSVDESLAVLSERAVPAFIKAIGPGQSVIPRLIEKGYEFKYTSPIMTWDADESLADFKLRDGLSVRRLDPHESQIIWDIYLDVYEMPLVVRDAFMSLFLKSPADHTYVLFDGAEIVSLVTAITDGDFVGIWGMGTPKAFQKKGYGAQLLKQVMKIHTEMGGKKFGLYATAAGKPLYDKLGWQTIEYIPHYGLAEEK